MIKRLCISLSVEQNYYLCELAKRWRQKKSNIIGNCLEDVARTEGITFDTDVNISDVKGSDYSLEQLKEQVQNTIEKKKDVNKSIIINMDKMDLEKAEQLSEESKELQKQIDALKLIIQEKGNAT